VIVVLVELGVVEQRLSAVLEVLNDGVSVTEVAERFGATRQSVHRWLRRYADRGLAGVNAGRKLERAPVENGSTSAS
jgi:transposase-like protein